MWACNFAWGGDLNKFVRATSWTKLCKDEGNLGYTLDMRKVPKSSQKFLWAHFFGEVAQMKKRKKKKEKKKRVETSSIWKRGIVAQCFFHWELTNEFKVP
jgi:hypothetical protein